MKIWIIKNTNIKINNNKLLLNNWSMNNWVNNWIHELFLGDVSNDVGEGLSYHLILVWMTKCHFDPWFQAYK